MNKTHTLEFEVAAVEYANRTEYHLWEKSDAESHIEELEIPSANNLASRIWDIFDKYRTTASKFGECEKIEFGYTINNKDIADEGVYCNEVLRDTPIPYYIRRLNPEEMTSMIKTLTNYAQR